MTAETSFESPRAQTGICLNKTLVANVRRQNMIDVFFFNLPTGATARRDYFYRRRPHTRYVHVSGVHTCAHTIYIYIYMGGGGGALFSSVLFAGLSGKKILVFTDRKTNVDRLEVLLRRECIPALGIHGDKLFQDRMKIINLFR